MVQEPLEIGNNAASVFMGGKSFIFIEFSKDTCLSGAKISYTDGLQGPGIVNVLTLQMCI